MKKQFLSVFLILMILTQPFAVLALTSSEAKQDWYSAKEESRDAQKNYRDAQIAWATDQSEENKQQIIDAGKESLHAALNEAEAWLIWRNLEVIENPEIPQELKEAIQNDVEANLAKIDELRADVDGVENRLELGLVFLKIIGKYIELVTDVAKNTGFIWVHIANTYADTLEDYETQLRDAAETQSDNEEILEKLDQARDSYTDARANIMNAYEEYEQVVLPGSPLLRFSSGNQYLRLARNELIISQRALKEAYRLIVGDE